MDFVEKLAGRSNFEAGDYIGVDGLLYCGKCHAPKQARVDGIGRIVPVTCLCREAEISEELEEARKKRVEELRLRCLPVEAMRERTFSTAGEAKHIKIARRYVAKWAEVRAENIGLMLWGNTGTGKSFTAQCVANALIDQEIAVRYISAVELVSALMDRERRE